MISQAHISPSTPMGATLVDGGGATFRVWAPRASAVYLNGTFGGAAWTGQTEDALLAKDANGYWAGFVPAAQDGDLYRFWVTGAGSAGCKRDPYARQLATDSAFPECSCVIRSGNNYPWHDAAFVTPDFSNMILYRYTSAHMQSARQARLLPFSMLLARYPTWCRSGSTCCNPCRSTK